MPRSLLYREIRLKKRSPCKTKVRKGSLISVSLVQGNCTLRPSGSLESVIAIRSRLSRLNLGPKRSKEQVQMKRKREREGGGREREREREKKRKAKKKSHEKLYNYCCKTLCGLYDQFSPKGKLFPVSLFLKKGSH